MTMLLGNKLRYLRDEELIRSIITGTYNIPAKLDSATTIILKEIGQMGLQIMNGGGNEIIITPEETTLFWKKMGEFTFSSSLGVHYGHFKAAIQDQMSTKVLALQLTVIAQSGILPESWSVSLQVILKKIAGVYLVEKFQAIQLYEADFNCFNHFIFSQAAMDALTKNNYLPEELFSQKRCTVEDAKFNKT
jgi:hypothetical protein